MKIPVVGFDPSLRHWGIAASELDLATGILSTPRLSLIEVVDESGKQVRKNSKDLHIAEQLARSALAEARKAKAVFVEVPVGSQSARAMASYGVCVGVLGAVRAEGIPLIEVSPTEVKIAFTGNRNATKREMIEEGLRQYPNAEWPVYKQNGKGFKKGDLHPSCEHVADAIGTIYAGAITPMFQNLMRLFSEV